MIEETHAASGRVLARPCLARFAALLLALAVASPLAATVWTRATVQIRIPKAGRVELEDVSYSGRDWTASLTALEVRQAPGRPDASGDVTSVWTIHYTNNDRVPHYVALTVRCLDPQRRELSSFRVVVTLLGDRPDGERIEQPIRMSESAWSRATQARILADFLSGPEG